ncbi:ankyrin [Apiospora rasikravindrae]|uniref:Ankyrin n=1 Tax=Apiospora rasikravindrae TaxID=990691 RepID=A0ABR1RX38_9PEZI
MAPPPCTWKREDDQCDRCIDHGIQCRLPRPATSASTIEVKGEGESTRGSTSETEPAAPSALFRNRLNCDTCRRHHQTCRPLGRKWPQKCERCIEKGFECGPPRSKKDYELDVAQQEGTMRRRRARRSTAGGTASSQQQQTSHNHTNGMLMLVESDVPGYAEDEEQSESSDREPDLNSSSSILVGGRLPPAKRQRTDTVGGADEGRARGNAAVAAAMATTSRPNNGTDGRGSNSGNVDHDLQKTIHTMEEEFQEVLRTEQERHDAEMRAVKAKYEQELAQQRERYEDRIDDLIKIMKSMGRVG